ncbi:hypothetical protein C0989_010513 [Termitomyces sp. Mn162]|nr:hypothetical protein C0989_010513 [Termitomyces sp. Mn162]
MRSRSFQMPYLSFAKFALSLSRPRRSSSEPVVTPSIHNNPPRVLAELKKHPVDVPNSQPDQSIRENRSPSPTPTEVEEPEPEVILEDLKKLNIKVRDFAYPSSSSRNLPPVPEVFDSYRGIAEYEYRIRMTPHIPVPGKIMRRLLAVGWVSMDEAKGRLRQIDWQALKEYDARDIGYPWRPMKGITVPTGEEREALYTDRALYLQHLDKVQASLRREEEWRKQERLRGKELGERAEQCLQENQERERKKMEEETKKFSEEPEGSASGADIDTRQTISNVSAGKKRALERSPSTPGFAVSPSTLDGPKRIKLSSSATPFATAGSSSQSHTMPSQPYQQYPAPLQAYDPRLYPDAAGVIAAENRPPVVHSGQVTPPVSDDEEADDSRPGVGLQRKKKGLKGLTRTQTFAQL